MLAGRVNAAGPYGWLAESPDLVKRIRGGFGLHRWFPVPSDAVTQKMRAEPLAAFLRKGLVPPPAQTGPLSAEEQRGKAIFESDISGCTRCHDPATEYNNNLALPLFGRRAKGPYDADPAPAFKVPSLYYVGGTGPYYHDGSAATLEDLLEQNHDTMGTTSHLTRADARDLVAYLKRIEPPPGAPVTPIDAAVPWAPALAETFPVGEQGLDTPVKAPAGKEELRFYNADPWPTSPSPEPGKWEWARAP
jgi:mono/diheme cytochrome c family protein